MPGYVLVQMDLNEDSWQVVKNTPGVTGFVGASNELGEFRAGVVAFWIGAVPAVALGGAATVAVAGIWSLLFPELRRIRTLDHQDAQPKS